MRTEFDNMNKHDTFMTNDNIPITSTEAEVVLYQPDENIKLEVRICNDTVWLTRQQMATLFGRDVKTIGKHINNALREELAVAVVAKNAITTPIVAKNATLQTTANPTVAKFAIVQSEGNRQVERNVEHYSLDMILSVGYRVHSPQGILFRSWANNVLKHYLLQGYNVNRQLIALQERVDERLTRIEDTQAKQQQQLDFFIRTSTPPAEMVFFEGDFYTARAALEALVKTATTRVIIIDGYVSSLTLSILDVRQPGVEAIIYTVGVGQGMTNLMQEHDRLFPSAHIDIRKWRNESHDRWLTIDDTLYHCGHSLNANGGHKISAITRMQMSPDIILSQMQ